MDPSDWSSDRPLDTARVEALVAEQVPDLSSARIAPLGSGWDSDAFEARVADARWVLRFPKRAEVQESLALERLLLPKIAAALPVAVPGFEICGEPSPLFPYTFVGYRRLPGVPLQERLDWQPSVRGRERMARQLGESLHALHSLALSAEHRSRLEVCTQEAFWPPLEEIEPSLRALERQDSALARRVVGALEEAPRPDRLPSPLGVLTHGDLDTEHILVDTEAEVITGIIDWADLELGPAAIDLMGVRIFGGESFAREVMAVRGPVDEATWPWLHRVCLERALGAFDYGRIASCPTYVEVGLRGLHLVLDR